MSALVQLAIGHIYADFTGKAAAARKTTPDKIDAVAQGRVWTGEQARARGLVDRTGSFADALATAGQLAKLDKDTRLTYVEREPSRLTRMMGLLGVQVDVAGLFDAALAPLARQAAGPSAALASAVLPLLLRGLPGGTAVRWGPALGASLALLIDRVLSSQ